MASVPYEIIAASKPFRFLVGPDKREFQMHSELVARMSKPLGTLVKGEWEEGKNGVVEWPEIDEGTFVRFCEFAYTGDYKAAKSFEDIPTPEEEEPALVSPPAIADVQDMPQVEEAMPADYEEPIAEPEPYDPWGTRKKGKKRSVFETPPSPPPPSKKDIMWQQFQDAIGNEPDMRPKEEPNTDPLANYSEVLISHARLYALADYLNIEVLMGLCVRKLHRTLKVFNLHKGARVTDIAQLIDYAYSNTVSRDGEQDKLRSLLATYAACNIEELWSNVYFQDVLKSGEVSKAIIGQLLRRVN
ncbi:hypothetical protein F5Y04DRAFT_241675 [Hypomontagnella monticulosa]|nr:hypothetical protein F5Y04DRAFT_241675 [Hypomontagnella monticulosa]